MAAKITGSWLPPIPYKAYGQTPLASGLAWRCLRDEAGVCM